MFNEDSKVKACVHSLHPVNYLKEFKDSTVRSNRKVLSMKSKTFSSGSLSGFLARNFQIIM
jgi:hypothetical protein